MLLISLIYAYQPSAIKFKLVHNAYSEKKRFYQSLIQIIIKWLRRIWGRASCDIHIELVISESWIQSYLKIKLIK